MAYNNPPPGDPNTVQGVTPGRQKEGGIAGWLGDKTNSARGPNSAAYDQERGAAQRNADAYNGLSTSYTQNAPTIANQYQDQSRSDIGGNVWSERSLANTLQNNTGEASKAQFQQGLDQSIDAQMAAANSAPGGAINRAGAVRSAAQNGALAQAHGAATSAALGAQEREAAQAQAAGIYGNIGGQLQSQYGLEQGSAMHQADLGLANQGQQNAVRLGYGSLGNQAQGQSEAALNDYTAADQAAQALNAGLQKQGTEQDNSAIGTVAGVAGGALSTIGGFLASGGAMGPTHRSVASVYGPTPVHAARPVTLADALAGIEHLKARIADLEGRHGR